MPSFQQPPNAGNCRGVEYVMQTAKHPYDTRWSARANANKCIAQMLSYFLMDPLFYCKLRSKQCWLQTPSRTLCSAFGLLETACVLLEQCLATFEEVLKISPRSNIDVASATCLLSSAADFFSRLQHRFDDNQRQARALFRNGEYKGAVGRVWRHKKHVDEEYFDFLVAGFECRHMLAS